MRFVTKNELLEMPPFTMFRPTLSDCVASCTGEPEIKTGMDFGAICFLPMGLHEEVAETYDWDGKIDLEDTDKFIVFEKEDIELLQKRLALVLENCDFEKVRQIGSNLLYDPNA